jgi:hypothetical protein
MIPGCKNGNAIALVFALLPAKSEDCYIKMGDLLIAACRERNLVLQPEVFHIDFEYAMHSAILTKFPNSTISCCHFHLGQSWWRKIPAVGLSVEYKDKSSEIGKWLTVCCSFSVWIWRSCPNGGWKLRIYSNIIF